MAIYGAAAAAAEKRKWSRPAAAWIVKNAETAIKKMEC